MAIVTTHTESGPGSSTEVAHDWVVGVDGSTGAQGALEWAVAHAGGRAARVHLLRCVEVVATTGLDVLPVAVGTNDDEFVGALHRELDEQARAVQQRLGLPVVVDVERRQPAAGLLSAAEGMALLIVGSRGRGGFSRLMLGSTSQQCATHCSVPTVVVPDRREQTTATRSLLVGVDGSPNSLAALRWALEFATPGSTVRAMSVWDPTPLAAGSEAFFFPEATDLAVERFHHLVEQVEGDVAHAGVQVEREFLSGSPRTALLEASNGNDLLVVGARGHGAVGSFLLGSVSTWLLHHASSPTVIVPGHHTGGPITGADPGDQA